VSKRRCGLRSRSCQRRRGVPLHAAECAAGCRRLRSVCRRRVRQVLRTCSPQKLAARLDVGKITAKLKDAIKIKGCRCVMASCLCWLNPLADLLRLLALGLRSKNFARRRESLPAQTARALPRTQNQITTARRGAQSFVGRRYHVYPHLGGVSVPSRSARCVQSAHRGLGDGDLSAHRVGAQGARHWHWGSAVRPR
jgi:hypothetical protein